MANLNKIATVALLFGAVAFTGCKKKDSETVNPDTAKEAADEAGEEAEEAADEAMDEMDEAADEAGEAAEEAADEAEEAVEEAAPEQN